MYGLCLVGMLAAAAMDPDRREPPFVRACMIGADEDDVVMMLGQPEAQVVMAGGLHRLSLGQDRLARRSARANGGLRG